MNVQKLNEQLHGILEDEFKPQLSEQQILDNVAKTLEWLQILLNDQKAKMENDSWNTDEIEDSIENIQGIMNGLKKIEDDLKN